MRYIGNAQECSPDRLRSFLRSCYSTCLVIGKHLALSSIFGLVRKTDTLYTA